MIPNQSKLHFRWEIFNVTQQLKFTIALFHTDSTSRSTFSYYNRKIEPFDPSLPSWYFRKFIVCRTCRSHLTIIRYLSIYFRNEILSIASRCPEITSGRTLRETIPNEDYFFLSLLLEPQKRYLAYWPLQIACPYAATGMENVSHFGWTLRLHGRVRGY